MELGELEVGEIGPRGVRERETHTDGARRVRGARPQRRGAPGGEHRAARGDRERAVLTRGVHAGAAPVTDLQGRGGGALEHVDAFVRGRERGELPRYAAAGGGPAGVHDAALGVAALQAKGEAAAAVAVEAHTEGL